MLNRSKRKAQFIVVITFMLGAVAGGLITYIVQNQQNKPAPATSVLDEIDRRVTLQPEQRAQVEAILQDARQQYKNLKIQHRPQFDAVREAARFKVRGILNTDQRMNFDHYVKELDTKRDAARKGENTSK